MTMTVQMSSASVKARWLAQSILKNAGQLTEHFEEKLAQAANLNGVSLHEVQHCVQQELQMRIDNFCDTLEEEQQVDDLCFYVKKIDGQFRYIGITYEMCYKMGILSSEFIGATIAERMALYTDDAHRILRMQILYERAWNGEAGTYVKRGKGKKSHVIAHIRILPVYKNGVVHCIKAICELFNQDEQSEMPNLSAKQIQHRECSIYGIEPAACQKCSFAHLCDQGRVALG